MDTLGKKIALYRHMRQWTQERLAYEISITQSTLSDIENDKSSPTWKLINEIARALDIPVLHLLPQDMLGPEFSVKMESSHLSANTVQSFDAIVQLIQTKDELIRAKDELIRELRGRNIPKKTPQTTSKAESESSSELQ